MASMPILTHLRGIRDRAMITQRELAKEAGVTQATIVRAEKGLETSYRTTKALAKALGVEPLALTSGGSAEQPC